MINSREGTPIPVYGVTSYPFVFVVHRNVNLRFKRKCKLDETVSAITDLEEKIKCMSADIEQCTAEKADTVIDVTYIFEELE